MLLQQKRDRVKQELDEIKFGTPNLLADGKKFYNAKDFKQARQKFQILLDKHSDMPQSMEAKEYLSSIDEEELWNNVNTSEDITISESYISTYPAGKYISKSRARQSESKTLIMQKANTIKYGIYIYTVREVLVEVE